MSLACPPKPDWQPFIDRFRRGEWRAPIFRDLILHDVGNLRDKPTLLDIGCGKGFDNDIKLQQSLAAASGEYIGIEPDPDIPLGDYFTSSYRSLFEDAPLTP